MATMLLVIVIIITAILFNLAVSGNLYSDYITGPIILYRDEGIESASKKAWLVMQGSDGNLVLYNVTHSHPYIVIWSPNTINATYTEITNDGNIIAKDDNGKIYWSSNSGGHNASEYHLFVMDFCAYLVDTHYTVLWSTCEDDCNVIYPTFAAPSSDGDTNVPTTQPTHGPTVTHIDHIIIPQNSSFMLHADKRIYSLSMNTFFVLQLDGNALLYTIQDSCQQERLFRTNTYDTRAEYVEFRSDGNIIVTDNNDTIYWQSNSGGHLASAPHQFVVIDECAYLSNRYHHVLYSFGTCDCSDPAFDPPTIALGSPTGAPTPKPTPIYMDHVSTPSDQSLFLYPLDRIASLSLNTYATFQTDGNFVLYLNEGCRHQAIWSTRTDKTFAKHVELLQNGNLRVMDTDDTVLFTSGTSGHSGEQPQHLVVTDECMYLMDSNYTVYWSQGSSCTNTFPTFSPPTTSPTVPTHVPTLVPTKQPTVYPTVYPTIEPTEITSFPTIFPTQYPTKTPTKISTKSIDDPTKVPITDDPIVSVKISSTYKATESDKEEDDTDTYSIWVLVVIFLLSMLICVALLWFFRHFFVHRSQKPRVMNEAQNITHAHHFGQDNPANIAVNIKKMSSFSVESHATATGMDNAVREIGEDSVESEGGQLTVEGPDVDLEGMKDATHQTKGNDGYNLEEDEFVVVSDEEVGEQYTIQ